MRLTIVRQDYRPEGTTERVTERALEALLERNVAVSLYTRSWPQTQAATGRAARVRSVPRRRAVARLELRARRVPRRAPLAAEPRRVPRAPAVLRRLPRRRRRPRRVAGGAGEARVAGRAPPRACCRRTIAIELHIERRLYASPWLRAVICNSTMVRDEIRERFAVPEAKLHVIPNPVDSDALPSRVSARSGPPSSNSSRIDAAATVFLLAAADFARADLATAIDAFAQLAPPAHLIAVGDDPAAARYRRARRARGVADRVTFVRGDRRPAALLTAPPTCSCCRRSTIPRPTSRSRRWRARCP